MHPLSLAILSGISFSLYIVCMRIAGPHVHQLLGATLTSAIAVLIGVGALVIFAPSSDPLFTNTRGILFACLAGLFAFFIEFFGLWAYARGLPINVGSSIIWGGGIAIAATIGFFLGESISLVRLLGVLLTLGGVVVVSISAS